VKNYKSLYLLIFSLLLSVSGISVADNSAQAQLQGSVNKILDILKQKDLDTETRRAKIREAINERFYFRAMSQRTLSRNWKKASPEQQNKFVLLFSKQLEQAYIGRLEAYTNEKIEFLRVKMNNAKRAVVYTKIITKTADIPINYKLALKNGQWLIYDVIIEEVSLISNYRSSYKDIIKKSGIDSLLSQMEKKLAENKTAHAS